MPEPDTVSGVDESGNGDDVQRPGEGRKDPGKDFGLFSGHGLQSFLYAVADLVCSDNASCSRTASGNGLPRNRFMDSADPV